MKRYHRLCFAAATLSCVSMLFSPAALAAGAAVNPSDVALHDGGVLVGVVVDAQGTAQAMTTVSLSNHEQELVRVRTDHEGRFSIPGLQGGVYRIAANGQEGVYRAWAPQTAPPVAQQGVTVVVDQDVVRGQYGHTPGPFHSAAQWCADHPLLCAAAIGAAIAIPIAVADDDDPPATP